MFTLPYVISAPAVIGLNFGSMDWPTAGVFLAWMAVAALVGSALGFLREHTSPQHRTKPAASNVHPLWADMVESPRYHDHREAA